MPSPVGHVLSGVAVYLAATRRGCRSKLLLGITLLSSVIPDFDFVPGILIGRMGAFHHGISHSLTFAALFGAVTFLSLRRVEKAAAVQGAMLASFAYVTHVILDFVGVSEGTRGVPILWPLSDDRLGFSLNLFGHFRWGDIRDGLGTIIRRENVMPVLREIVVVGSAVIVFFLKDRRLRKSSW